MVRMGFAARLPYEDRRLLERIILPYFQDPDDFARALFVGCGFYTWHYKRVFAGREYWTIDSNPDARAYGSDLHVVASVTHADRHFAPGYFDLIVCNGVFGWGLNDRADVEAALGHFFTLLRRGGVLVFGWDDVPGYRPFDVRGSLQATGLKPFVFPPLGTAECMTATPLRHIFNFYRK
jgi:SAM-dependent methyltransferase